MFYKIRIMKLLKNNLIIYNLKRFYTNRNVLKLYERGIFQDIFPDTASKEVTDVLNSSSQTVYAGFDPTADSLHVGNLLVLVTLLHWQRAGHRVVALIGGATAQVGDPSGRSTDRPELSCTNAVSNAQHLKENIERIFKNHEKYFWFEKGHTEPLIPPIIEDNVKWYNEMSAVHFVSRISRYFRMGTLLSRVSVKERLASPQGMSCAEFTYQIFQAYDWLYLLNKYNCRFQVGGSDQMGNIMSGHDLISRLSNTNVYGLTLPIITTESGEKLGKSAGNSIWLAKNKSSPFSFYQYWIRQRDSDVSKLLRLFTFLNTPELESVQAKQDKNSSSRIGQSTLAKDLTLLVHGEEGLISAEKVTDALYGKADVLNVLQPEELVQAFEGAKIVDLLPEPGMTVLDLAKKAKCFNLDSDALRIISAGGFYINHKRTTNLNEVLTPGIHILPNNATLIRVGKKNYYIIRWLV